MNLSKIPLRLLPIILLVFCCFLFACRSSSPSEESFQDFCLFLEKALNDDDKEWIDGHFDTEFVINKVTENIDAPEYYSEGFKQGFATYYTPGTVMAGAMEGNGQAHFLRMKTMKPPVALFRILSEAGLNYQEISLDYDRNGEIYVKDFYSLSEGEWFSQGIRRLYIINLAGEMDDFDHPLANASPIIAEVGEIADRGNLQEAFDKILNVPKEVLKEKIVLLILLNLGQDLGPEALQKAVSVYKEIYPDDALVELKQMEFAFLNQEPSDKVLKSLDNLEARVGEDAYLDILRGSVHLKEQQLDQAQVYLEKAIKAEPDNDQAYWSLIDLYIQNKQYDKTIVLFSQFKEQFDENAADYIIYDGYNDFYLSPQYRKWIEANPLESDPNIKMDSIIQAVEEMMEKNDHDHDHDHEH